MRSPLVITFALLMVSSLLLTACGSAVENPVPGVDEPLSSPDDKGPYPYPDNELYLPVTGSNPADPYPGPNGQTEPYPGVVDPYPGFDNSGDSDGVLNFSDLLPEANDRKLESGNVFLDGSDLIVDKDDPGRVEVRIIGNLPTPCHKLRIKVGEPTEKGHIQIEAYTVTDPETLCVQVLVPFETSVPLTDLAPGDYTVFINGEQVGSFELP